MIHRYILLALGSLTLAGCGPYLRVEDRYQGHYFVGTRFTPGAQVEVSVLNAPIPCGASFCPGPWQSIGTVPVGNAGGAWPNIAGHFGIEISRIEMATRRGVTVTCYPGSVWDLRFTAKDPVTGKIAFHSGATTSAFYSNTPPCRQ